MNTKITVLADNIPGGGMRGEWGLSLLVEYGNQRILADAGSSPLFAENMEKLGLDISSVDYATLSHAHYDHANGMPTFFKMNSTAPFYLRDSAEENCYAKKWIFRKYIGLPRNVLTEYSDRIRRVSNDYRICDGVWLIPHKSEGLAAIGKREMMFRRTKNGFVPDDFSHEQSLVLDTDKGLVIINCCCHGGVVNIIREVRNTFPEKQVHGIIGGFHLFNKTEQEVRGAAQAILETGVGYICTGHCTGEWAYNILKQTLGSRLQQLHVGLEINF